MDEITDCGLNIPEVLRHTATCGTTSARGNRSKLLGRWPTPRHPLPVLPHISGRWRMEDGDVVEIKSGGMRRETRDSFTGMFGLSRNGESRQLYLLLCALQKALLRITCSAAYFRASRTPLWRIL